jgi:anti-sigma factor RsiW
LYVSDHLSPLTLNALADGELAIDELASAMEHLHGCSACTSRALEQSLLKSATARSGQRYALPDDVQERMKRLVSSPSASRRVVEQTAPSLQPPASRSARWIDWTGWAVAAVLLLAAGGFTVIEMNEHRSQTTAVERAAVVTEVSDQHIATLAANLPPQVLSSDRHTVKPWFQGKIPFSFNLPENLPEDTKLEGANLAYLHNRPVAQLLYSIGKHRVSVFVQQKVAGAEDRAPFAGHAGFRLASFSTNALDVIAISDVDPARLTQLMTLIERAQTE